MKWVGNISQRIPCPGGASSDHQPTWPVRHEEFATGSGSQNLHGESTCHLCGKTFHGRYQKYNLRRHLSIHAGSKPFVCIYCSHRTNQKYNMQQHLLVCRKRPKTQMQDPLGSQYSVDSTTHAQK